MIFSNLKERWNRLAHIEGKMQNSFTNTTIDLWLYDRKLRLLSRKYKQSSSKYASDYKIGLNI